MSVLSFAGAEIAIVVGRPDLAKAIAAGIAGALIVEPPPTYPTVTLRTRRRLAEVGVTGRIAIVRVTARSARRLPGLVEEIRQAGALGVQLVWDGTTPPRADVEPFVFRVLERARATRESPPVVLARTTEPALALRIAISKKGASR